MTYILLYSNGCVLPLSYGLRKVFKLFRKCTYSKQTETIIEMNEATRMLVKSSNATSSNHASNGLKKVRQLTRIESEDSEGFSDNYSNTVVYMNDNC